MRAALDQATTERFGKEFNAHPTYRLMQNAVATTSVDEVTLDRAVVTQTEPSMSHLIDDWQATDQKRRAVAAGCSPPRTCCVPSLPPPWGSWTSSSARTSCCSGTR